MMSLLTRFALLSSIIYFAVPGMRLPHPPTFSLEGTRIARIGLPPGAGLKMPAEMQFVGKAIGFNPHGLQKIEAQLAHITIPTPAEQAHVVKRLSHVYTNAQHMVGVLDKTGVVVSNEVRAIMRNRTILVQTGESLKRLNFAAESVREGVRAFTTD